MKIQTYPSVLSPSVAFLLDFLLIKRLVPVSGIFYLVEGKTNKSIYQSPSSKYC